MKVLDSMPLAATQNENPFQETRRKELLEFWESGAKYAELEMSGTVTVSREIDCYKRAARQLYKVNPDIYGHVKIRQRHKKVIAERVIR